MVKLALDKLSADEVVELDDDKKAAMVSNRMVVLCGGATAPPVGSPGHGGMSAREVGGRDGLGKAQYGCAKA